MGYGLDPILVEIVASFYNLLVCAIILKVIAGFFIMIRLDRTTPKHLIVKPSTIKALKSINCLPLDDTKVVIPKKRVAVICKPKSTEVPSDSL